MHRQWKIAIALPLVLASSIAHAAVQKVAVFDFELVDTSLEGATYGPRADQQKVSNLILNMNIVVRDVRSGRMVSGMSVDMRCNTGGSWSRALDWLVRYYLLAPPGQGVF